MYLLRKKNHLCLVFFGLCLSSKSSFALEFQPGVGVGAQYTNNAELASDNEIDDVITTGYVGASIIEDEGSLIYGADASLRRESYLNDTFEDRRYFNLGANANWEMLRDRFDWYLSDHFSQRPVVSTGADTPANRQDTNIFIFGANINFPFSGRQQFSIVPQFSQYYYEVLSTDNRQYSLAANWNYQMFRLTNVGLNFNARNIVYDNQLFTDTSFTNFGFIVSGKRVYSNYTINLGATNVKRDTGEEEAGYVGNVNLATELSSRSTMEALILSEITDTSTVSQRTSPGNPDDVQLSTDVIRNSILRLTYFREDAALHSRIWGEYRKLKYSDNTALSRLVQTFGAQLDFPVTQLVSSGIFVNFSSVKRQEIFLEDRRFNVGANINVTFTNKLSSSFNVQYRTKESTNSLLNYDEFSLFASLNYGFGGVNQRTAPGGY